MNHPADVKDFGLIFITTNPNHKEFMSLDQMCIDAKKRIAEHINRSAGQHLRAMKKLAQVPVKAPAA